MTTQAITEASPPNHGSANGKIRGQTQMGRPDSCTAIVAGPVSLLIFFMRSSSSSGSSFQQIRRARFNYSLAGLPP